MTTRHRQRADEILRYARKLDTYVIDAIVAIDEGLAGWPTSTPGANPATDPVTVIDLDPDGRTAGRGAAIHTDPCRADLDKLLEAMRIAEHQVRIAALIVEKYAVPRLDRTTIAKRLAASDASSWCTNHLRHGMQEPRREGGTECQWCADFKVQWKTDAPAKVLDFRSRGVRLDAVKIRRMIGEARQEAQAAKRAARDEKAAAS